MDRTKRAASNLKYYAKLKADPVRWAENIRKRVAARRLKKSRMTPAEKRAYNAACSVARRETPQQRDFRLSRRRARYRELNPTVRKVTSGVTRDYAPVLTPRATPCDALREYLRRAREVESPETAMWAAVIAQSVEDTHGGSDAPCTPDEARDARNFLRGGAIDTICALATLRTATVRYAVTRLAAYTRRPR